MKIELKDEDPVLVCGRCGYTQVLENKVLSEKIESKNKIIVLSEKDKKKQLLPTTKIVCPSCGFEKAYYWEVQTRSGDEGTTQFFRCVKCSYTWRLYT